MSVWEEVAMSLPGVHLDPLIGLNGEREFYAQGRWTIIGYGPPKLSSLDKTNIELVTSQMQHMELSQQKNEHALPKSSESTGATKNPKL